MTVSPKSGESVVPFEPRVVDAGLPAHSEDAMALRFANEYQDLLRWCEALKCWMVFDGTIWRRDRDAGVFDKARAICREVAHALPYKDRAQLGILTGRTRAAVVDMVKSDRRLATLPEQWDRDPWALNTPGGVVNLKTGKIRPALPTDYGTKSTAAAPGGDCPRFKGFLLEIMGGDKDMVFFFQRIFGYALTGSTKEHSLTFFYGTGSNGKSVLLNAIAGIMDDYHTMAAAETFQASKFDRHPTELAALRGARLVTAVETEDGRAWAESRIKALTGGDPITARVMRGDPFTFTPIFKLIIAGNHKPSIRTVDEAIRRRLYLVPFAFTVPEGQRDPDLPEKLKDEWPGILAWMIEGCLEWQRQGLNPPTSVQEATAEYLESEDALADWLNERCEINPAKAENSTRLYESWKKWAEAAGERIGSQRKFAQKLVGRGFEKRKTMHGAEYNGLALLNQHQSHEP